MSIEIKVPSVGESVQEAVLSEWLKKDGDTVEKDEPIFVLETDKVTLEVNAEADGVLRIKVEAGETVAIGAVVGEIETDGASDAGEEEEKAEPQKAPQPEASEPERKEEAEASSEEKPKPSEKAAKRDDLPPSVRRLAAENDIDLDEVSGTGPSGRITKGDVLRYLESGQAPKPKPKSEPKETPKAPEKDAEREKTPKKEDKPEKSDEKAEAPKKGAESDEPTERKAMTPIRRRIASRLLEARQNTAMLTTFNDIDMSRAMEIRSRYKEAFKKKYDVSLGFMSFFAKASVHALMEFPAINAFIDGNDIIYHHYYHLGIAIGSERGLVVPVLRHVDRMSFAEVEQSIIGYVEKIKSNKLELADLEGATFTITNGGVFGSLLSTPILNTPQSGILGMHRIEKRPVVVDDEIVIRPMMYVALSYDHRIVDGREAVTFLRRIKEFVENPERMLMEV